MTDQTALRGVIAAAVTPLDDDDRPDLGNLRRHLQTLAAEGCDGVLVLGTTGEGPSMSLSEREAILETTLSAAGPMRVLAGTGSPSLSETIALTRRAYELGVYAAVIIPPYFYKSVHDNGLIDFYRRVLDAAVPDEAAIMLYHIPQVSQVPITAGVLDRLLVEAGSRMLGIKDSTGSLGNAQELCSRFPELHVFVGDDKVLLDGLRVGARGCITAGANVLAPLAVAVYRAHKSGEDADELQERLTNARKILDLYPPLAASLKRLLADRYRTPGWRMRPPLRNLDDHTYHALCAALDGVTQTHSPHQP